MFTCFIIKPTAGSANNYSSASTGGGWWWDEMGWEIIQEKRAKRRKQLKMCYISLSLTLSETLNRWQSVYWPAGTRRTVSWGWTHRSTWCSCSTARPPWTARECIRPPPEAPAVLNLSVPICNRIAVYSPTFSQLGCICANMMYEYEYYV